MNENPHTNFPSIITIADKYEPAMKIADKAEADAYFEKCVRHSMAFSKTRQEAEKLERTNLAYFAGHYSHETRRRVERLFQCEHPLFGSIADNGPPTPEEALNTGLKRGKTPQ